MMDEKYVVLKAEDWELLDGTFLDALDVIPLEGCIVIRKQDVLSAPMCWHYSSLVRSVIEAMELMGQVPPENLEQIADYFSQEAESAEKWPLKKLPD